MKNQTAQEILGMNSGTSASSQKERSPQVTERTSLDGYRSLKAEFEQSITLAKSEGIEWLETDLETIKLYISEEKLNKSLPKGYFIYKDVKVTTPGNAEKIEAELNIPMSERMNPEGGHIPGSVSRVKVLSKDAITTLEVER